MTELEKLIQRFRTNRPKSVRHVCLLLRAITNARAPEDRVQGYPRYPELEDVLDNVPTASSVTEVLLNAEAKGQDIRELWHALDEGLNWGIAKRMLRNARRDFEANPALSFKEHLRNNIADPARAHERADRKPRKSKRRRALGRVPSVIAPQFDPLTQKAANDMSPSKRTPTPSPSNIQQRLVELADAAARAQAPEGSQAEMVNKTVYNLSVVLVNNSREAGAALHQPAQTPVTATPVVAPPVVVFASAAPAPEKPIAVAPKAKKRPTAAPAVKAKAKGKETAKEKAKIRAIIAKAAKNARARKRGKIPPLTHDPVTGVKLPPPAVRVAEVVGDRTVTSETAIALLGAFSEHWVPYSEDLRAYMNLLLSAQRTVFERVTHGVYRVRQSWRARHSPAAIEPIAAE